MPMYRKTLHPKKSHARNSMTIYVIITNGLLECKYNQKH